MSRIDGLNDVLEYTDFSQDIDLTSASSLGSTPARLIEVVTAGSGGLKVVMQKPDGSSTAARTLSGLTDGKVLPPGLFVTIKASGTTVTKVRVWW